jgi:predicted unusual protein kinase regulating ubiquinone biosynthesis (AarF/ABC1/UbiB family)
MVNDQTPGSAVSRGLRLGALGFRVTGSYLAYQLQNLFLGPEAREEKGRAFRRKTSRQFREELQSLKGPLMKMGQVLSMQDHVLPAELIEELASLQMHAPAMHPTLARAQFKASYGKYPEEVFGEFEPEPFAAASLGQVHRAMTKRSEQVVVKIQYPAMRTAIKNDFALVRSATLGGRLTGHIPKPVLDEVEQGILKETDYLNEARNIDFFREQLSPLDYVRVPRVFWDLTTDRVLTMSRLEGVPLGPFLSRKPASHLRNLLGRRLLDLFLFQIHQVRAFHADSHPGNYLFTNDASISLVDFGCVKVFTPEFAELIHCFLERAWEQGEADFARMMRLLWGPEVSPRSAEARSILEAEIELFNLVFPPPETGRRVVAFNDRRLFDLGLRIRKDCLLAKLARPEFPFYARAELGLYNYLRQLGAKFDTVELLQARRRPAGGVR